MDERRMRGGSPPRYAAFGALIVTSLMAAALAGCTAIHGFGDFRAAPDDEGGDGETGDACAEAECAADAEVDGSRLDAGDACVDGGGCTADAEAGVDPCEGITACAPGSCERSSDGGFRCDCPEGFSADEQRCICPFGKVLSVLGDACVTLKWQASGQSWIEDSLAADPAFAMARDGTAVLSWWSAIAGLQGRTYERDTGWLATEHQAFTEIPHEGYDLRIAALSGMTGVGLIRAVGPYYAAMHSFVLRSDGFEATEQRDADFYVDGSYDPRLASDGVGRVLATWYTYDTQTILSHSYVDAYVQGMGWRGPVQQREISIAPTPALGPDGAELLAFEDRYMTGTDGRWGPLRSDALLRLPLTMGAGDVVIGGSTELSSFDFEQGWRDLGNAPGNASAVTRIDAQGRLLQVWIDGNTVKASYDEGEGWEQTETVSAGYGTPQDLRLAMEPNGDAVAAWVSGTSQQVLRAVRFDATHRGWGYGSVVHDHSYQIPWFDLAMSARGHAVIVWVGTSGSSPVVTTIASSVLSEQ